MQLDGNGGHLEEVNIEQLCNGEDFDTGDLVANENLKSGGVLIRACLFRI